MLKSSIQKLSSLSGRVSERIPEPKNSKQKILFILGFFLVSALLLSGIIFVLANLFSGPNAAQNSLDYGLVAHWDFNEGSGQVAYDRSKMGNNLTLGSSSSSDSEDPVFVSAENITNQSMPYWIEETTAAKVWIKIPTLAASATRKYAISKTGGYSPDGNKIFSFFDDFNGQNVDLNKWEGRTDLVSLSNGVATFNTTSSVAESFRWISKTQWYVGPNSVMEMRNKDGCESGFWSKSPTSYIYEYIVPGLSVNRTYTNDGTGNAWLTDGGWDYSNWHVRKIVWTPTLESFYEDGVSKGTLSTKIPTIPQGAIFSIYPYYNMPSASVDWVLFRKYASTAPTVSVSDKGTYYEVSVTNNLASSLTEYQVEIPTASLGISNDKESLEIRDITTGNSAKPVRSDLQNSLSFDGANDYAAVGSEDGLTITGAITLAGWVKVGNLSKNSAFFGRGQGMAGAGNYGYFVSYYGSLNEIDWDTYSATAQDAMECSNVITDNEWHYITATWDGTTNANGKKLYVDGRLACQKTSTISAIGTPAYNFSVGKDGDGDYAFPGAIDEVRVYNRAITEDEIQRLYNGKKPIMELKFDEGTGTVVKDESFLNNDITLVNSPSWALGKNLYAIDLESGSSQYGYIEDNKNLSVTGDFTVSAWVRPESITASTYFDIANKWDGSNLSYSFNLYGDEVQLWIGNNYKTTNAANLTTGSWYHIEAVYDASAQNVDIYVNGSLQDGTVTGTIPTSIDDNASRFHIGAQDSTTTAEAFFDGNIDDFRLYQYVRGQDEVLTDYNDGLAARLGGDGDNLDYGLVGHWNFEEGSGQIAYDKSLNGNNGILGGTTSVESSDPLFSRGDSLSYWIESTSSKVWVKLPEIAASGSKTLYVYKGGGNSSDGNKVFEFFDDFNGSSLDGRKWITDRTQSMTDHTKCNTSVSNGVANIFSIYPCNYISLRSSYVTDPNVIGMIKAKVSTFYTPTDSISAGYTINLSGAGAKTSGFYWIDYKIATGGLVSGYSNPTIGTYYLHELRNDGSNEYYRRDGGAWASRSYTTPQGGIGVVSQTSVSSASVSLDVDWMAARKYVSTEPTVSVSDKGEYYEVNITNNVASALYDYQIAIPSTQLGITSVSEGLQVSENRKTGPENGTNVKFDGADDYVNFGTGNGKLDFTGSNFTIGMWVNQTDDADRDYLSKFNWTGWKGYAIYSTTEPGYINLAVGHNDSTVSYVAASGITPGTWHHILYTFDGTYLRSYRDGKFSDSAQVTKTIVFDASSNLYLAYPTWVGDEMLGSLDDLRMYNRALSESEIQLLYNQKKPIMELKFDEKTGSVAKDESFLNNNITLLNSPSWVSGKFGNALDFEASSSQCGYIEDNSSLFINSDFTMSAWIKPESTTAATLFDIAGKWDNTNKSYLLAQYGDEIRVYIDSPSDYKTTDSANLVAGNWYHIRAVYDASAQNVDIYVDDILQSGTVTGTIPSSLYYDSIRTQIGCENSVGTAVNFYDGIIDDFKLYQYALNEDEMKLDYYNENKAVILGKNNQDLDNGLMGYWNFEEGSGQVAYDRSGNANKGIFGASASVGSDDPTFVSGNGYIPYWIESESSNVWVKVPKLAASASKTLYVYKQGGNKSNGGKVFEFFDDFNGNRLDDKKWEFLGFGTASVSNGVATVSSTYPATWSAISSRFNTTSDIIAMARAKVTTFSGSSSIGTSYEINRSGVGSKLDNFYWVDHSVGWGSAVSGYGILSVGTYYVHELRNAGSTVYYRRDRGTWASRSYTKAQGGIDVMTESYVNPSSVALDADWIAARKYASTEPTVSVSDQGGYYKITLTNNIASDLNDYQVAIPASQLGLSSNVEGLEIFENPVGVSHGNNVRFDGVDDYIDVGSIGNPSAFSISAWVYYNGLNASWKGIVDQSRGVSSNGGFTLSVGDGTDYNKVVMMLSDGTSPSPHFTVTEDLPTNQWVHILGTWDGTTSTDSMKIYFNGIKKAGVESDYGTMPSAPTLSTRIGNSANTFAGSIDEVRVYSRVLSNDEIQTLYNQKKPILHLKMDEGSGSVAYDESFNNNDGTLGGGTASCMPSWVSGKISNGLSFDGTNDYISIVRNSSVPVSGEPYTISAWIKDDTPYDLLQDPYHRVVAWYDGSKMIQLGFGNYYTNRVFYIAESALDEAPKATTVGDTPIGWHHIAATSDGSGSYKLYLDGILNVGGSIQGTATPYLGDSNNVFIGQRGDSSGYVNGLLDDVRIYQYARTAEEILVDYNSGLAARFR